MKNSLQIAPTAAFVIVLAVTSGAFAESTGQYIDDAAITTKVKAALMSDDRMKGSKISVETNQGTVQLSGTALTKDQETEAVKDANKANGVRAVKDMIAVEGTKGD